jgi:hypothetical protein
VNPDAQALPPGPNTTLAPPCRPLRPPAKQPPHYRGGAAPPSLKLNSFFLLPSLFYFVYFVTPETYGEGLFHLFHYKQKNKNRNFSFKKKIEVSRK